jgi:hypothetical protein
MRTIPLALAFVIAAGVAATSAQQSRTSIGVLTCTSGESVAEGGGAESRMTCGFKPTGSGGEERYSGTVRMDGQAASALGGKRVWVWAVIGPDKVPGGVLAQRYVVAARPTKGAVAAALVGESNDAITLQAETADGAVGTATQVELKLLTTPA